MKILSVEVLDETGDPLDAARAEIRVKGEGQDIARCPFGIRELASLRTGARKSRMKMKWNGIVYASLNAVFRQIGSQFLAAWGPDDVEVVHSAGGARNRFDVRTIDEAFVVQCC